jgi:hypothetical protein
MAGLSSCPHDGWREYHRAAAAPAIPACSALWRRRGQRAADRDDGDDAADRECYTIFRIGHLLTLHVFLGMLLLGPVTLKAGSVLYRFVRYYTGNVGIRTRRLLGWSALVGFGGTGGSALAADAHGQAR